MRSFLVAASYLTIVPIYLQKAPTARCIARSRYWYPVIGFLLGATLGGVTAAVGLIQTPAVGAFVVVLAWVSLTGAFHLDGCCDLCDGLFGGHTPEQRLAIMKDPHVGTFGLAGGVLVLLGKFAAVQTLLTQSPIRATAMVVAATVVARCLVLLVAGGATYPREEGTGKAFIEGTRKLDGWIAAGVAALVAAAATPGPDVVGVLTRAAILFAPALLTAMLLRWACDRRIGGVTGDCLGAAIELVEVIFLLAAVIQV